MTLLSVDILKNWFATKLDLTCVIENVVYDGGSNQSTLTLDDSLHLREQMIVTISAVDHTVISSDESTNTIVLSGDLQGKTSLTVEPLYYDHGSPLRVNADNLSTPIDVKYPMAYVYELLREKIHKVESPNLQTANVRLFLLDSSNTKEWNSEEHYNRRIRGIAKLATRIIRDLRNDSCCFYTEETEFERTNQVNWGQFADNKGHTKSIFNAQLSGLELKFDLVIRKNCDLI